jgi:hypothetical protein
MTSVVISRCAQVPTPAGSSVFPPRRRFSHQCVQPGIKALDFARFSFPASMPTGQQFLYVLATIDLDSLTKAELI